MRFESDSERIEMEPKISSKRQRQPWRLYIIAQKTTGDANSYRHNYK